MNKVNCLIVTLISIFFWLDNYRYDNIGIATKAIEALSIIGIIFNMIHNSTGKLKGLQTQCKKSDYLPVLFMLFLLISLISWIYFSNNSFSTRIMIEMLIGVALYFALYFATLNINILKQISIAIAVSGILANFLSLYGYYNDLEWAFGKSAEYNNLIRFTGLFSDDPNYSAMYIVGIIPLAFYMAKMTKHFLFKFFAFLGIFSCYISLILTYSRAGGIVSVAMVFLYFFNELTGTSIKKKVYVIFGFICALFTIYHLNTMGFFSRLNELLNIAADNGIEKVTDDSLINRYYLFIAGVNMFAENIFTGVGIGNFQYKSMNYGALTNEVAHNTYINIAAELGIFGICLYLFILYCIIRNFYIKPNCLNVTIYNIALSFRYSFFCYLIMSLFLVTLSNKVLFFYAGLSSICLVVNSQNCYLSTGMVPLSQNSNDAILGDLAT